MRIRRKLLLILMLNALAGAVLVGVGAVWLVRSAARDQIADRIRAETAILSEWVRAHPSDDPHSLAAMSAGRLGFRVTLITAEGTVLGDSARDRRGVLEMENHLHRPEVQEAISLGEGDSTRTSATTGVSYLYIARRVEGAGPIGFVRIAVPLSQLGRIQARYSLLVTAVVLVAFLLVAVLAYGYVRRLSKPVEAMSEIAERTAQGELDLEVPEQGRDEVSRLASSVNRMKRALLGKVDELEDERALFHSVISGMREGLLLVGSDRRIRLANDSLLKIFDLRLDPTGHLLAEVIRHPGFVREVESAVSAGKEVRETIVRIGGSGRAFELHVTPLDGRGGGSAHGALALLFDITRLEALEGVRREFVANVSHELRTPLTSIKAFVETLIEGDLKDRENSLKFLEIIRKHTDRMESLISDLTDLSRIETGAITLDLNEIDAGAVARDVAEQLQPRSRARDVEVRVEIPEPFTVKADRRRLEQMLTNLVDNAIKFNRRSGEVWIRARMEDHRPVLVVEDNGIGIPADSLEKIFHRFYRVDPERSRKAGGTGLGLSIVKHLIRLHGGKVTVDSELGRGTRFSLEFPPPGSVAA